MIYHILADFTAEVPSPDSFQSGDTTSCPISHLRHQLQPNVTVETLPSAKLHSWNTTSSQLSQLPWELLPVRESVRDCPDSGLSGLGPSQEAANTVATNELTSLYTTGKYCNYRTELTLHYKDILKQNSWVHSTIKINIATNKLNSQYTKGKYDFFFISFSTLQGKLKQNKLTYTYTTGIIATHKLTSLQTTGKYSDKQTDLTLNYREIFQETNLPHSKLQGNIASNKPIYF